MQVILNFQKEADSPQLINREIDSVKFFSVKGIKCQLEKEYFFLMVLLPTHLNKGHKHLKTTRELPFK